MLAAALLLACLSADAAQADRAGGGWETTTLSDTFYAEGGTAADFDRDGHVDVVVGPHLYFGPDWLRRREIHPGPPVSPLKYSDEFLTFAEDLTGDGYPEVISIGFPGKETVWYENPGRGGTGSEGYDPEHGRDYRTDGHWKRYLLAPVVDNESPGMLQLVGDEARELVAQRGGSYGYFTAPEDPKRPWVFHPVSEPQKDLGRFTHGIGAGDVDGDGRIDLLTKDGWFRQPESLEGDPLWEAHPHPFADKAAQMFAFDVDGDGDADVVTARDAHGYGLDWWEQTENEAGETGWTRHVIMGDAGANPARDADGDPALFTQPHALAAADVNGDGLTDLVTGKRFWAHGPKGDVDPGAEPVLYWWELTRGEDGARFVPHKIDGASGVGTQVHVSDVTGDGKPDVVVGNKRGAFVAVQP